jgi:membrane protein
MGAREKVSQTVGDARQRAPWLDHLIRAWSRYQSDSGDRLAASVTYFGFLSFFPIIALAFSVAGFVVDAYPSARTDLIRQINNFLPGLSDKLNVTTIGDAKVASGIIGLLGLLLAGLGWIDALREAIRVMWHHNIQVGNFIKKKGLDVAILAGLGLTMIASVAVTGISSSAMGWFLQRIGLEGSLVANILLRIAGYVLALGVDVALFLFLLIRLPKVATPFRQVLKGAVLGAFGFEILKTVGSLLVKGATHNPVYGIFAVVVGLLIWINYLSRFTLFVAAWTVTAPYDTDVRPSGTADPAMAEEAEIAPERVTLVEPVTLQKARPNGQPPGTEKAKAAGYIGVGMMAAGAMGVAWSGLKTARELVRR